jgi:hypothetical protein
MLKLIRVIKSKRMRWVGQVWEREELLGEFRWGNVRERENLEYLGADGRIILKWIFKEWVGPRLN